MICDGDKSCENYFLIIANSVSMEQIRNVDLTYFDNLLSHYQLNQPTHNKIQNNSTNK